MDQAYITKNGLVYSNDLRTVLGVDTTNNEFTGQIPYGPKYIEDEVFGDCPYANITMPDSMETLGAALFENSKNLVNVKLPANVKELPPYLFSGCSALAKVTMPNMVNGFSEGLFNGCCSLIDIPFRAGIKELPESCIAGCSSVKSLVIPGTVEVIGNGAAAGCTGLVTLVLPAALKELAEDAFEGCNSIRNIRIDDMNPKFYVNEEDGCLYERTTEGDKLRIAIAGIEKATVSFFDNQLEEKLSDRDVSEDAFFTNEFPEEEDEDFSAEITAAEVSYCSDEIEDEITESDNTENENIEIGANEGEVAMITDGYEVENEEMDVKSVLSDIMEDDDNINAAEPDEEVSIDELDKLFSSNTTLKTPEEVAAENAANNELDGKTKILVDTVGFSSVIECEPEGEVPEDGELFVVAEKTVTNAAGERCFTEKLINCVKKFAKTQDFKRIILLADLPVDNEEFMRFYHIQMSQKNIILACEAPSPAKLSDYAKMICEESRISLEREELVEQRNKINTKNNSLIKLVIQDKYN